MTRQVERAKMFRKEFLEISQGERKLDLPRVRRRRIARARMKAAWKAGR